MFGKDMFAGRVQPSAPRCPRARILDATSLVFWLGTVTAGRLLAYIGNNR
jgi:hypothetical protein